MATIISHSAQETARIGEAVAPRLRRGDVLALAGDLGAGKTQFTKGLAAGLGIGADVTSPTFTLIHEYPGGRLPLFHIDLYRLDDDAEALGIGLEDYTDGETGGEGVTLIEWADKFPALLPAATHWVRLQPQDGDRREITLPDAWLPLDFPNP